MEKYFLKSDFQAFDSSLARRTDDKVIRNRIYVVNKLRDLHEEGLKKFMAENDLHPHGKENHLTSVVWPLKQANGEYVDYVRIGYGLSKDNRKKLSEILQMYNINEKGFMKDDMAFHYLTQIQLSVNEKGWNISLYLGQHGWLEQKNLVKKLDNNNSKINKFIKILNIIMKNGYILYLDSNRGEEPYDDSEKYINKIIEYSNKGISFTIYIANKKNEESIENDTQRILSFIVNEFEKLIPLYKFIAWNPNNNYI